MSTAPLIHVVDDDESFRTALPCPSRGPPREAALFALDIERGLARMRPDAVAWD